MVLKFIYECVSLLAPECDVCLCVCVCGVFVCVTSNQSTSKKTHYVSDLSKVDALLCKIHSKVFLVLRYQGLIFVDL